MPKTPKRASPRKDRSAAPEAISPASSFPVHDRIAARAYELFVQRGGQHGSDREDWLLAERELTLEIPQLTRRRTARPNS